MKDKRNFKKKWDIGFIFDFDGTLLDDTRLPEIIIAKMANEYHVEIDEMQVKEMAKTILETKNKFSSKFFLVKVFLSVAKKFGISPLKRISFLKRTNSLYKKEIINCPFVEGTEETLSFLHDKALLGLLTNTPLIEVKHRLGDRIEFLNLFNGLDNICTGDMVENQKPDPEGILKIIGNWNKMNISRQNIFIVGDMNSDIIAAKKAGCRSIAVLSGVDPFESFEETSPDLILKNVGDIPKHFDEIRDIVDRS